MDDLGYAVRNVTAATDEELRSLRALVPRPTYQQHVYWRHAPRLVLREDVEDYGLDPANDPTIVAVLEPDGTETPGKGRRLGGD